MPIKTVGYEWNKFYTDEDYWGKGQWHDDVVILVDGTPTEDYDCVPETAAVTIDGGYVVISGDSPDESCPSMESYFKKWKKKQEFACLVVECKKDKVNDVVAAIKLAGGKCKN